MRRRTKAAIALASVACVGLSAAAVAVAPGVRARRVEAQLPPDPLISAKPGDWAEYRITKRFTTGGSEEYDKRYVSGSSMRGEPWLDRLFPGARFSFRARLEVSDDTRVFGRRPFECKRVSASLGEGDMKRTVTYWLTPDVRPTGYVARSIAWANGNSEEEELVDFGQR